MSKSALFAVLAAISFSAAAGGIYKWTDASGRVHDTDQPPPADAHQEEMNAEISVTSFTGTPVISSSSGPVAKNVRVKLYGTSWCGVCKRARAWLSSHNVPYDDYDVEASPKRMQEFEKAGGTGYPLIIAGRQRM